MIIEILQTISWALPPMFSYFLGVYVGRRHTKRSQSIPPVAALPPASPYRSVPALPPVIKIEEEDLSRNISDTYIASTDKKIHDLEDCLQKLTHEFDLLLVENRKLRTNLKNPLLKNHFPLGPQYKDFLDKLVFIEDRQRYLKHHINHINKTITVPLKLPPHLGLEDMQEK